MQKKSSIYNLEDMPFFMDIVIEEFYLPSARIAVRGPALLIDLTQEMPKERSMVKNISKRVMNEFYKVDKWYSC